ncbi:hypothetical protein ScalyP_jg3962 [Parmales sp. scaly parma]|nr:hypothetical protein ScalyP_jg3962 [Parmales sp. scaly parma]
MAHSEASLKRQKVAELRELLTLLGGEPAKQTKPNLIDSILALQGEEVDSAVVAVAVAVADTTAENKRKRVGSTEDAAPKKPKADDYLANVAVAPAPAPAQVAVEVAESVLQPVQPVQPLQPLQPVHPPPKAHLPQAPPQQQQQQQQQPDLQQTVFEPPLRNILKTNAISVDDKSRTWSTRIFNNSPKQQTIWGSTEPPFFSPSATQSANYHEYQKQSLANISVYNNNINFKGPNAVPTMQSGYNNSGAQGRGGYGGIRTMPGAMATGVVAVTECPLADDVIHEKMMAREAARYAKDYSAADNIREELRQAGIYVDDKARTFKMPDGRIFPRPDLNGSVSDRAQFSTESGHFGGNYVAPANRQQQQSASMQYMPGEGGEVAGGAGAAAAAAAGAGAGAGATVAVGQQQQQQHQQHQQQPEAGYHQQQGYGGHQNYAMQTGQVYQAGFQSSVPAYGHPMYAQQYQQYQQSKTATQQHQQHAQTAASLGYSQYTQPPQQDQHHQQQHHQQQHHQQQQQQHGYAMQQQQAYNYQPPPK